MTTTTTEQNPKANNIQYERLNTFLCISEVNQNSHSRDLHLALY